MLLSVGVTVYYPPMVLRCVLPALVHRFDVPVPLLVGVDVPVPLLVGVVPSLGLYPGLSTLPGTQDYSRKDEK